MAEPPQEYSDQDEADLALPQDEDENVLGETDAEEEKAVTGTAAELEEAAGAAMLAATLMCLICGLHARKKAQIFCAMGCEGLVRAASRDAKSQGPEQFKAWQALRKMGGRAFRDSLMSFQARCGVAHRGYRRPVFAWARQLMVVSMSTVVQKGKKCIWLSKTQFVNWAKDSEEMNDAQANAEWFRRLEAGRKTGKASEDMKKLLTPVEDFVTTFSQTEKKDELQMAAKDIKNPHDSDLAQAMSSMGSDHDKFSDRLFTDSLGLTADMMDDHGEGAFMKSSAPSEAAKKAEALEQQAKEEKKAAAKAKKEAQGKKVKTFERDAVFSLLLPDLASQTDKARDRSISVHLSAKALIEKVNADIEVKDKFKNAVVTLAKRLNALVNATYLCGGDPADDVVGTSEHVRLHKRAWQAFLQDEDFKQEFEKSKETEPCKDVYSVLSLSELYHNAENPACDSNEDVKQVKKQIKADLDLFRSLAGKVAEQEGRLKYLYNKSFEARVDELAKQRKKEEDAAKMAAVKAAAKAVAKKVAAKTRQFSIIECSGTLFKDCRVVTSDFFLANAVTAPAVIHDLKPDVPDSLVSSLSSFMENDFKTSKSYTGSGRGAKMMELSDVTAANSLLGHFAKKTGTTVLEKVDRNEKVYIQTPWFFGYSAAMSGCGPEFAMLSSLKYTIMGERICVMAPYDRIENVMEADMRDKGESTDTLTPQMVCDYFSEANAAIAGKMDQWAVRMKVGPGSLLYVPWGWVVCERTINGSCTAGFRWLMLDDSFNESIATLASRVLPSDGSKAKSNTSVAFLQRVCTIVNDLSKENKVTLRPPALIQLADKLNVKKEHAVKAETSSEKGGKDKGKGKAPSGPSDANAKAKAKPEPLDKKAADDEALAAAEAAALAAAEEAAKEAAALAAATEAAKSTIKAEETKTPAADDAKVEPASSHKQKGGDKDADKPPNKRPRTQLKQ